MMPPTLFPPTKEEDAGAEVELTPALREELLDSAAWQKELGPFARAIHLGVALLDRDGRQRGPCLNPRSLWSMLHARLPDAPGVCPFAVAPPKPCPCVAEALRTGTVAWARDRTGLVHFAVPLLLGEHRLGALVAGQVFDKYPEQLPLEHIAKKLDLSPEKVWEKARREHPVSPPMLGVYADLLATLGRTFLLGRYHTIRETSRLAELRRAEEALRQANGELEKRVEERTAALKQAQKKALQVERLAAIGQMIAGLAHEGRNALQRIQAGLVRLALRLQGQPENLEVVDSIQKAEDDLHRLFEETRLYAAPIRLEPRACNLAEIWRKAWADLDLTRQGRPPELREEIAGTDLDCVASPFHLTQVFRNILHNSLAAKDDAIRVVIRCAETKVQDREAVTVSVRDNGPGFTAEQQAMAFEPFFTTKLKGTGLGLAICKRIVEAHGGRIELGAGPEPGAEIFITLPREPA